MFSTPPAAMSRSIHRHPDRPARRLVALAIILAAGIVAPASAADPAPAAARSGSCTGWSSRTVPPPTIRVGRLNGRGGVDEVDFRRYVGVVMAKEWPSHLPRAVLEVAAVAVKQYAWYHAMAGRHRSSFRTAGGACYDVVDSTRDQLYRPEQVRVSRRIRNAVDATWGLSLRKAGRFFLTGYRQGNRAPCGADADGWKLYARSVIACGRAGLSREQIQALYYGSNLRLVWASGESVAAAAPEPPPAGEARARTRPRAPAPPPAAPPPPPPPPPPPLELRAAAGEPVTTLAWGSGAGSGDDAARYVVEQHVGDDWQPLAVPETSSTRVGLALPTDGTRRFRVRTIAGVGRRSAWTTTPSILARPFEEISDQVYWMGNWRPASVGASAPGVIAFTNDAQGGIGVIFSGRSVALLGARGPGRPPVRIFVDGAEHAVVELAAEAEETGWVIFSREWPTAGYHVVRLETVSETAGQAHAAPPAPLELESVVVHY